METIATVADLLAWAQTHQQADMGAFGVRIIPPTGGPSFWLTLDALRAIHNPGDDDPDISEIEEDGRDFMEGLGINLD